MKQLKKSISNINFSKQVNHFKDDEEELDMHSVPKKDINQFMIDTKVQNSSEFFYQSMNKYSNIYCVYYNNWIRTKVT